MCKIANAFSNHPRTARRLARLTDDLLKLPKWTRTAWNLNRPSERFAIRGKFAWRLRSAAPLKKI